MVDFIRMGLLEPMRILSRVRITKCKILAYSGIRTRHLQVTKRMRYQWATNALPLSYEDWCLKSGLKFAGFYPSVLFLEIYL